MLYMWPHRYTVNFPGLKLPCKLEEDCVRFIWKFAKSFSPWHGHSLIADGIATCHFCIASITCLHVVTTLITSDCVWSCDIHSDFWYRYKHLFLYVFTIVSKVLKNLHVKMNTILFWIILLLCLICQYRPHRVVLRLKLIQATTIWGI